MALYHVQKNTGDGGSDNKDAETYSNPESVRPRSESDGNDAGSYTSPSVTSVTEQFTPAASGMTLRGEPLLNPADYMVNKWLCEE